MPTAVTCVLPADKQQQTASALFESDDGDADADDDADLGIGSDDDFGGKEFSDMSDEGEEEEEAEEDDEEGGQLHKHAAESYRNRQGCKDRQPLAAVHSSSCAELCLRARAKPPLPSI